MQKLHGSVFYFLDIPLNATGGLKNVVFHEMQAEIWV